MNKDGYIVGVMLMGFLPFGCTYVMEQAYEVVSTPDNFIEEIVEEIIEDQIGWDIDLSPHTEEED